MLSYKLPKYEKIVGRHEISYLYQRLFPASIGKIKDNKEIIVNKIEISNISLNDYFLNIAENITKTLPKISESPIDYHDNKNINSIFLSPVNHIEVESEISKIDSSKSSGPSNQYSNQFIENSKTL